MYKKLLLLSSFFFVILAHAQIQATSEGFDDVENLPGWIFANQSTPIGDSSWFQGAGSSNFLIAQGGEPNSYIAANHRNTGGEVDNPGTICNFLIMPDLGYMDSVSFYTKSRIANNNLDIFPDRLYLVHSPSGGIETGNCTDGFGDFTDTMVVVNPDLTEETSYPGGYPIDNWQKFEASINKTGRVAFVYYVENAGFYGENSNYIGIDSVEWKLENTSRPQPGLYYDRAHSGHGFSIEPILNTNYYFVVFFTYKDDGTPEWFTSLAELENGTLNINSEDDTLQRFIYDYNVSPVGEGNPNTVDTSTGTNVLKIDFDNDTANASDACNDGTENRSANLALASWQLGEQTGDWCIEAIISADNYPTPDFGGIWWTGRDDTGWGFSLAFANDTLVATVYYFDAQGQPRWVQGIQSGFVVGQEITLDMREFNGYARDAAETQVTNVSAGSLSLTLNSNTTFGTNGSLSINVTYQGSEGGTWQRDNMPIFIFTEPHN